jgi:uncharacterized protein YjbI with pentapeptide repeats
LPAFFWVILGLIVAAIVGGLFLWIPLRTNKGERGSLGSALLTGGLISLAFWALQDVNGTHQQSIAHRQEQHERQIALRQEQQQREVAAKQTLLITVGLQKSLVGADLAERDLRGIDLSGKDLEGADLQGAQLSHARLIGANLRGATLDNADVSHADLKGVNLREAHLNGVRLQHTYMFGADLMGAIFGRGNGGRAAELNGATLINADAHGACMAGADLRNAKVSGADFTETNITGADLRGAVLEYDGIPLNLQRAFTSGLRFTATSQSRQLIVAGSWHPRSGPPRVPVPASATKDEVSEIFDSDTLRLRHRGWVRLLGVKGASPESRIGGQSTAYVRRLAPPHSTISYRLGPEPREPEPPDVGRWLGYVWLSDGTFLNQALLERGEAKRDTKHREYSRYATVIARAERDAKAAARGLWQACPE